jgi:hypothetical protein
MCLEKANRQLKGSAVRVSGVECGILATLEMEWNVRTHLQVGLSAAVAIVQMRQSPAMDSCSW